MLPVTAVQLGFKGAFGFFYRAFAVLQLYVVLTYLCTGPMFWTLLFRSAKASGVIGAFGIAVIISGIAPIGNVTNIAINLSAPLMVTVKALVRFMFSIYTSEIGQKLDQGLIKGLKQGLRFESAASVKDAGVSSF